MLEFQGKDLAWLETSEQLERDGAGGKGWANP